MAYTADTLAYDVIADMAPREIKGEVVILGKRYALPRDKVSMTNDVRSKLWCTYRKNFRSISGTNLSCDTGWGCTLRCGQMLLAQALICQQLGREYRWIAGYHDPSYIRILRKFLDIRDSEYSLQMIALQGADFGRPVGQWFGPNNVAQAIKKLVAYDLQSQLAVHVAMDMLVVIDDLKAIAREPHGFSQSPINVTNDKGENVDLELLRCRSYTEETPSHLSATGDQGGLSSSYSPQSPLCQNKSQTMNCRGNMACSDPGRSPFSKKCHSTVAENSLSSKGVSYLENQLTREKLEEAGYGNTHSSKQLVGDESQGFMKLSFHERPTPLASGGMLTKRSVSTPCGYPENDDKFRSLLLFIPLRLGQDSFNFQYADSLKECLTLPQSVGFIGGRPRHALYFIGYNEDTLLYLDPHTTQQTVHPRQDGTIPDASYHTSNFGRMHISGLDPSIALGFFCKDENDLDDLVVRLKKCVLKDSSVNMFELTEHRPSYWGPFKTSPANTPIKEPFLLIEEDDDFEEFEIINWPLSTQPQTIAHGITPTRLAQETGSFSVEMEDFLNKT